MKKMGIYVEDTWVKGNLELVGLTSVTTDSHSGHNILETQYVPQVPAWVTKGEARASEAHGASTGSPGFTKLEMWRPATL